MDYNKELEKTKEKIAELQRREEIIMHRKNILDRRAKMERQKARNSHSRNGKMSSRFDSRTKIVTKTDRN